MRQPPPLADGTRQPLEEIIADKVDLETGAIVAVTLQGADQGDTTTIVETATTAKQVEDAQADVPKGYHSNQTMVDLDAVGIRS